MFNYETLTFGKIISFHLFLLILLTQCTYDLTLPNRESLRFLLGERGKLIFLEGYKDFCAKSCSSPGQTIATCQRQISQHCWAQHVACVGPPWCVATCWVLLAQVWKWSYLSQQHPTRRNMLQQGGQTHATCCAQQCCEMLRWHVAIVLPGLWMLVRSSSWCDIYLLVFFIFIRCRITNCCKRLWDCLKLSCWVVNYNHQLFIDVHTTFWAATEFYFVGL